MQHSIAALPEELANRVWKQSSTFRRLVFSRHVLDLQLIVVVTLLLAGAMLWWYFHLLDTQAANKLAEQLRDQKFVGAVLLISGTIVAWVYQTGSKRLGIVDLFACEIVTLCRVGTIMEVVPRLIAAHKKLSEPSSVAEVSNVSRQEMNLGRFTSEENYFPVFDHNNSDLQVLEADVVINVTAFYTYMKAFRDQLRSLGALGTGEDLKQQKPAILINAIYMIFLGYESARKSIVELIEFEPTQAEAMVTGLVSELRSYHFLRQHFDRDDIRGRRLALREDKYGDIVPPLYYKVMSTAEPDWENARSTAIDLEQIYNGLDFTPKIVKAAGLSLVEDRLRSELLDGPQL